MHTSKPVKVFVGILTFFDVIFPFVIMPILVILFFLSLGISSSGQRSIPDPYETEKIVIPMMIFYTGMMCFSLVQFGLKIFYIIHEIKNKALTDNFRILFVLGTFLLSFVAMPIYFFAYLRKDDLQEPKPSLTENGA